MIIPPHRHRMLLIRISISAVCIMTFFYSIFYLTTSEWILGVPWCTDAAKLTCAHHKQPFKGLRRRRGMPNTMDTFLWIKNSHCVPICWGFTSGWRIEPLFQIANRTDHTSAFILSKIISTAVFWVELEKREKLFCLDIYCNKKHYL